MEDVENDDEEVGEDSDEEAENDNAPSSGDEDERTSDPNVSGTKQFLSNGFDWDFVNMEELEDLNHFVSSKYFS